MRPKLIQFEGGDILANLEDRTITGLLIPYNEVGRTNLGRFQVEAGAVELPTDPSVVSLNLDHERHQNVGRAVRVFEQPEGVFATFQFANTPEGDAALADALSPTGLRRKLSAEFGPAMIKAGKLVAGHAKLWGAAQVGAGAFPSAQVLAADTPDDEDDDASLVDSGDADETIVSESSYTSNSSDGASYSDSTTTTEEVEDLGEGRTRITRTTVAVTETTDTNPEGETLMTLATARAPRAVPATQVMAGAPVGSGLVTEDRPGDKRQVLAAMSDYMTTHSEDARQVLAALTSVKHSGAGSLPIGGGAIQPNWVGQINEGVAYVREYINLGTLGTDISAEGKKGFKMKRGTEASPLDKFDGSWAGNRAAVNSYNGFTQSASSSRRNFAIAEGVAREFYDLPGGLPVIEAFFELILEDYYRQSDEWALADWIDIAGDPIAPATAKYSDKYPEAVGQIIQGILAVKRRKADGRRDVPSFAIANEAAFEEMAYAAGGEENLPAFVSLAISTASEGRIDGNVQIVQGETGIEDTPSSIVGAGYAIEFDELPGGPLTVDALAIANGGLDKAVHGYVQTFKKRPEAVVLVGVADTVPAG